MLVIYSKGYLKKATVLDLKRLHRQNEVHLIRFFLNLYNIWWRRITDCSKEVVVLLDRPKQKPFLDLSRLENIHPLSVMGWAQHISTSPWATRGVKTRSTFYGYPKRLLRGLKNIAGAPLSPLNHGAVWDRFLRQPTFQDHPNDTTNLCSLRDLPISFVLMMLKGWIEEGKGGKKEKNLISSKTVFNVTCFYVALL